jgi:hypothetical protein
MNAKNFAAAALLLFVAASVVVLVNREMDHTSASATSAQGDALPANALVVYYFHGATRCPTCRNIESYSHDAVQTAFADQLARDKILWKVVNYEEPANSHFATDFDIVAPTVVLVRTVDGKPAEWRNLPRVWELVGDQDEFTKYIQDETRAMLGT